MTRPLRIEFCGALYHVTARGNRQGAIYENDADRLRFVEMLGQVAEGWNWVCHAYCLMTNHYHLVLETPDGNLAKGMRQLNGIYTQASNRHHRRVGHLFQGRYKAILVDKDAYLLALARYVVLNPVRAGMVNKPGDWMWSSYRAMMGETGRPSWLETDGLLAQFGNDPGMSRQRYAQFVAEGIGQESIWSNLKRQIYLGDESFIKRMQGELEMPTQDVNIARAQRRPPAPVLEAIEAGHPERDQAILAAYETGEYSYQQIAAHFGIHFTTIGRIVRKAKEEAGSL